MGTDRRRFLRNAGALTIAGVALGLPESSSAKTTVPNAMKLAYEYEGVMPFAPNAPFWVLSPGPPPQALLDILPLLYSGVIQVVIKQRMSEEMVNTKVHIVAGPNYSVPMFPLPPSGFIPISDFNVRVLAVTVGQARGQSRYTFGVLGQVVQVIVPSVLGELLGRTAAFGAEFDSPGQTAFYLAGGFVAGNHTTWVPVAAGTLHVNPAPTLV